MVWWMSVDACNAVTSATISVVPLSAAIGFGTC
jgi:hypothetical protein